MSASDREKTSSNMYGILVSVAMAGTIAGVSILFGYVASHGEAFNGIVQLLMPQSQSVLQAQEGEEKKGNSNTNVAEANPQQETQITTVEVRHEQNQPAQEQENKASSVVEGNAGNTVSSNAATEPLLPAPKADDEKKPVNNVPVNSAADITSVSDTAPPRQEPTFPDKSQEARQENNTDETPNQANDRNNATQIQSPPPSSTSPSPPSTPPPTSQSTDRPPVFSPPQSKPTPVQDNSNKQMEEQQKALQKQEEQAKKEQKQQVSLLKEKNGLEEKLHKQTDELQKKIQEVLKHNADNAQEAEKKLYNLYAKAPDGS
jgi:hypothetical protein